MTEEQAEWPFLISKELHAELKAAVEWYIAAKEVYEARIAPLWERVKEEAHAHGDPTGTMLERTARGVTSNGVTGRPYFFQRFEHYLTNDPAEYEKYHGESLNRRIQMIGLAMLTLENIQAQEAAAAQEEDELLISKKLFEDLVAAMEWYNNAPLDDPIEVHSAQREARFAPVWERVKQEARAHGDPMATMEERLARALVSDDYAGRQLYFLIVESYMREKATWQDFCGELNERTRLVGQAVLAVEKIQAQEVAVQDAEPQTKHR